nr:response regulator [Eubacterium sp.]
MKDNQSPKKWKILIIDDVEANRFALRDIIQEMGYQPILAEHGKQALKVVARMRPELIISDISMPEMDGYEFCETIKKDAELRDIPIIFISAFDNPEDIMKGFNVGGEDYITKPFIPEVVKARVILHLRLYDATQDLQETNRQLQTLVTQQVKQLELEKKNVLYALTRVARENACYDERHMERLCYNCRIMAEAMQLSKKYDHIVSDSFVETIELAAPLCDLGNVAIPTNILQKKDSLSEAEAKVMQTHAMAGTRILQDVLDVGDYNDFIQMSMDIAHYHHENWDGSGYPEGVKGEDIPLPAQIMAVVSVFCALTETRVYRDSYDTEAALEIMEKDSGIKFNPALFDILKKIHRQLR